MKRKKLLHIPLIAMLIVSMAMVGVRAGAYPGGPGTTMWVDDQNAQFQVEGNLTCTKFNVSIRVQNVADLGAWEFKLSYNTTLLDVQYLFVPSDTSICTDWVPVDGGVWHPDGPPSINEGAGIVWTGALFPSGQEFTGNGTLLIIEFHITYAPERLIGVKNCVNSTLHLYDTGLKDSLMTSIPHSTIDGLYKYCREPIIPGAPVCCFTWDPVVPYVCDNVTLDASCSTPNGGVIISYKWTITGPADPIGPLEGIKTWFHCNGTGIVHVTLNVTDSEGMWDDCSADIEQLEKVGCMIDVFTGHLRMQTNQWTPHIGIGPGINADAYGPNDEVWLYVEVLYNGAPVNHALVAFEVLYEWKEISEPCDPFQDFVSAENACIAYGTAETNKTGLCAFNVRVPVPCDGDYFGKWLVIATVKVQDVWQMDYLRFDVNYLVRIVDMWTTYMGLPEDTFYRAGDWGFELMDFGVVLKSIAWMPKEVWVVIVVYDECSVPLGQLIIYWQTEPADYCHPTHTIIEVGYIKIPQWAFVGVGKVCFNVFHRLPKDYGVAYAPACCIPIIIKLGPRP